jgi:hypothetical protein
MLTEAQVRRYSTQSGLRDMMIAEKEVVLTFLLQLLSDSRKKFAPAVNATRRGTFMIWGCTRRGRCNRTAFVDWWC